MVRDWLRRRIKAPLLALLKQGLTPEKLALSLSLGFVISCLPIWGTTTWICIMMAAALRLNQVAIQVGNYLAYPLQIMLIIPFVRLGETIFGISPISLSPARMKEHFQADFLDFFTVYGASLLRGALAWLVVAPFAAGVLYLLLTPILRRAKARSAASPPMHD